MGESTLILVIRCVMSVPLVLGFIGAVQSMVRFGFTDPYCVSPEWLVNLAEKECVECALEQEQSGQSPEALRLAARRARLWR